MRFLLAVAVLVGLTVMGTAQEKPKQYKTKAAPKTKLDAAPKSTVRAPAATTTAATSKELGNAERKQPRASGTVRAPKKAPGTATLKPAKEPRNPPINFGGKGGKAAGGARQPDSYQGRLKQKGSFHH